MPRPHRLWSVLLVLALVVHLAALYWPLHSGDPAPFPGFDKLVHLGIFGALTGTALMAGLPRRVVVPLVAVHAPVSEIVQGRIGRDPSIWDVAADLTGVALAVLVAGALLRRRERGAVEDATASRCAGSPGTAARTR